MKTIASIVPFPFGAQSDPFFGALASALLPLLGYTEDTPFYCAPKGSICIGCGECSEETNLQKHHGKLYHDYQTFTGVSLGWFFPEDPDPAGQPFQTIPGGGPGWDWPDAFIDFIMRAAGLRWTRLRPGDGRQTIWEAVAASIDAGRPVLLKLGDGVDWHVVTGYDEGERLVGLDAHKFADTLTVRPDAYTPEGLFVLSDWYAPLRYAIVITGRTGVSVQLPEILARMIDTLAHPAHARLEAEVMRRIDGITPDNAQDTAVWLNKIVGFPIEARWHAADSSVSQMTDDPVAREKLGGMVAQYVFDNELDATHGTCWKIWAALGVGTDTGYAVTDQSGKLIQDPQAQAELKRLFAIVFANDRIVLGLLREALAALSGH